MKYFKYSVIVIFAVLSVVIGIGGCSGNNTYSVSILLEDSFWANYNREILSYPQCRRDSGFYYRGRADAFLELKNNKDFYKTIQ